MPPELKQQERICESNSPECSGMVPCGKCYYLVLKSVIPGAMRAGGFGNDKSQADAFLKAYVMGWRTLLEEKLAERKAQKPSSFVTPPQLLEFFAYREATRAKESAIPAQETTTTTHEATVVEPASPKTTKPKKGSKLLRGDLKRMVEKQAKEPLANGTGTGGGRRDSSEEPAKRDEEKH